MNNFSEKLISKIEASNGDVESIKKDISNIRNSINKMIYIGEVSKYYKFTIGLYDVLLDRISGKMYFVIYSSDTLIREIDINDPGLYMPIFIVG